MQELLVEIGLRVAKLVIATVIGLVVYAVLTGPFGAPPPSSSRWSRGSPARSSCCS